MLQVHQTARGLSLTLLAPYPAQFVSLSRSLSLPPPHPYCLLPLPGRMTSMAAAAP